MAACEAEGLTFVEGGELEIRDLLEQFFVGGCLLVLPVRSGGVELRQQSCRSRLGEMPERGLGGEARRTY